MPGISPPRARDFAPHRHASASRRGSVLPTPRTRERPMTLTDVDRDEMTPFRISLRSFEPKHFGSGWMSGVASAALGLLGLGAVACFHYPSLLTVPELRSRLSAALRSGAAAPGARRRLRAWRHQRLPAPEQGARHGGYSVDAHRRGAGRIAGAGRGRRGHKPGRAVILTWASTGSS